MPAADRQSLTVFPDTDGRNIPGSPVSGNPYLFYNRIPSVLAQKVQSEMELPDPKREEISGTVASLRLDSIIALAFHTSRSSMIPFIEGGKVFVNGKSVVSNGYVMKDGDIVSVRGKGKFQFGSTTCKTKKNRCHVVLYRYC